MKESSLLVTGRTACQNGCFFLVRPAGCFEAEGTQNLGKIVSKLAQNPFTDSLPLC
jgi:hypothetical protein